MKLIQLLVIFLLISFILFIMFQVEDVEGFNVKNIEGMTDPDLPPCPRPKNTSGSTCGSVTKDKCLDDFRKLKRDNYILKTKVVTPVCPNNPYDNIGTDWKKEHDEIHKKEKQTRDVSSNSLLKQDISSNSLPKQDVSSNRLPSLPYLNMDLSSNRPSFPSLPKITIPNILPKQDASSNQTSSNQAPNFFNSNTMMNNNSLLSTPEKKTEPEPAKAEDKKSTPEDLSKCPPCPACERCPEPTVDCKRVVKYKNQSFPVPVIADFSNFSRFG